jgi:PBP1b-binding outer membrane lipoprotein LpoB
MNTKVTLLALALLATMLLAGCGAGHPTLTSITVTPSSATASIATRGSVGYTATGMFSDHSSRQLTQADGLTWATANGQIAGISDSGMASCVRAGVVTVTATAPSNLTITVTNTVTNTSPKVTGSAALTCM